MSIKRNDSKKTPLTYTLEYRVAPQDTNLWKTGGLDPAHEDFGIAKLGCAIKGPDDFYIPTFQRGIEWDLAQLQECLASRSPLLGEVTFGLEAQQPDKLQLLDGLQRFASFTALSHCLRKVLFAENESDIEDLVANGTYDPALEASLKKLRLVTYVHRGAASILSYNHVALKNHHRAIVNESYIAFFKEVSDHVDILLQSTSAFAMEFVDLCHDFYSKGMWANEYRGFPSHDQLVSAFVGWNAIRIELGLADLCRAALIDKGSQCGWTHDEFVEAENTFNELLLKDGGSHKNYYGPFITLLHEDWREKRNFRIIPSLGRKSSSWNDVKKDFDILQATFEYFDGQDSSIDPQKSQYIRFLKLLGDLPFISVVCYHYLAAAKKKPRNFDALVQVDVLHKLSVAYFRRFLDAGIGNTGDIASEIVARDISIKKWLEKVTPDRSGLIDQKPASNWLRLRLENAGYSAAKPIFSACQLPVHTKSGGSRRWASAPFSCWYRRAPGRPKWSLDHIIPKESFKKVPVGTEFRDSLRNLAPVLTKDNNSFKNTDADTKVKSTTMWYAKYRDSSDQDRAPNGVVHPYHQSLFKKQRGYAQKKLNAPDELRSGIGDQRLALLHDILIKRI